MPGVGVRTPLAGCPLQPQGRACNPIYSMRPPPARMVSVRAEARIRAPPEEVWAIVSDLDGEPRYWRGTRSVRNVSESGGVLTREITIAFRGKKCMQEVTVVPMERIEAAFTEGVMRGTKILSMRAEEGPNREGRITVLEAAWDVRLAGMMGMFDGAVGRHIRGGTEQALAAIKEESERRAKAGKGGPSAEVAGG